MKHTFFEVFPCLPYEKEIERIAKELQQTYDNTLHQSLNNQIASLYQLTEEEQAYISENL